MYIELEQVLRSFVSITYKGLLQLKGIEIDTIMVDIIKKHARRGAQTVFHKSACNGS